jgi:hypothetical protein
MERGNKLARNYKIDIFKNIHYLRIPVKPATHSGLNLPLLFSWIFPVNYFARWQFSAGTILNILSHRFSFKFKI